MLQNLSQPLLPVILPLPVPSSRAPAGMPSLTAASLPAEGGIPPEETIKVLSVSATDRFPVPRSNFVWFLCRLLLAVAITS
jgi:hypothetical protein